VGLTHCPVRLCLLCKKLRAVFQRGSAVSAFPLATSTHSCWTACSPVFGIVSCFVLPFLVGVQDPISALICNCLVTNMWTSFHVLIFCSDYLTFSKLCSVLLSHCRGSLWILDPVFYKIHIFQIFDLSFCGLCLFSYSIMREYKF